MPTLPPVYTKLLFRHFWFTSVGLTFGPPPTGKTWIMTDVDVSMFGAVSPGFPVFSLSDSTGAPIVVWENGMLFPGRTFSWRGRQVLEPPDTCNIGAGGFVGGVRICGYELSSP